MPVISEMDCIEKKTGNKEKHPLDITDIVRKVFSFLSTGVIKSGFVAAPNRLWRSALLDELLARNDGREYLASVPYSLPHLSIYFVHSPVVIKQSFFEDLQVRYILKLDELTGLEAKNGGTGRVRAKRSQKIVKDHKLLWEFTAAFIFLLKDNQRIEFDLIFEVLKALSSENPFIYLQHYSSLVCALSPQLNQDQKNRIKDQILKLKQERKYTNKMSAQFQEIIDLMDNKGIQVKFKSQKKYNSEKRTRLKIGTPKLPSPEVSLIWLCLEHKTPNPKSKTQIAEKQDLISTHMLRKSLQ